MSSLFHKTKLKEKNLHIAHINWPQVFTRVSNSEMVPKCEAAVNRFLDSDIQQQPSKKPIK